MMQSPLKNFSINIKIIISILLIISLISIVYASSIPVILLLALGIVLIVNSVMHLTLHLKTPSIFRSIDISFLISITSATLGVYLLYKIIQFIYF